MKKIITFIASGIIPSFIPICALLTLPVCIAERYIPQDLKNSFAYGVSFFKLVINPHLDAGQAVANSKEEELGVPIVEATVTSMAFAAEADCEDMPVEILEPVDVLNKDQFVHVRAIQMKEEFHKAQSEMKHLQFIRDIKLAVPAEKMEIAIERALRNVETSIEKAEIKKRDHRTLRVVVRKKAQVPA